MSQTITKHIGEGFAKGELYAALAYDAADSFGGMKIKSVMFNEDGKAYFYDTGAYISASSSGVLDIVATTINITGAQTFTGVYSMGTMDVGIAVTTAAPFAFEVHTEPLIALVAGQTGLSSGIRSRYHISVAQTNQISISAIEGRLRVKAGLADGCHAGISGTIEGDASIAYTGTATTQRSAGNFCLSLGASSTISAGWLCGVTIDSTVNANIDMANCTFAALRIKKSDSALNWEYGLHIENSDIGIAIGACTTGISLNGAYTNAIKVDASMANPAISDGSAMGCQIEATMTGTATGMFSATSSWANINGTTGYNWVNAITTGIWENGAAGVIANGVLIFGMRMQAILTHTNFARLCPFALNASTATVSALFSVGNTNLGGDCGYIEATTEGDAPIGYVPLLMDSNNKKYYVRVYADTD